MKHAQRKRADAYNSKPIVQQCMSFQNKQFDYNPDTRCYVAEASTLGVSRPGNYISIDGYAFVFTHADHDAVGEDIAGWRYKPTANSVALNSALAYCTALIIND